MPSPARRTSGSRAGVAGRDDIPLARRTLSPALKPRRSWRLLATGAGSVLLVASVLAAVFPQPLRRLLAPPPVQGLSARLSLDGRLLGHFPYGEVSHDHLVNVSSGTALHRDAAESFSAMQAAAAADGIALRVLSGFRSIALQKHIFFDVKSERNQSAQERARVSAPPGFSEHSTGYAMDLGDGSRPGSDLSVSFQDSPAFAWLQRHANRYHFHLSFPRHNRQGVSYEPWHWRFEGTADALRTFEAAQRLER